MSSGGDSIRMCGLADFSRCEMAYFRDHEGAARVDLMHQVETAHVGRSYRRQPEWRWVVDHDVDAPKCAAV